MNVQNNDPRQRRPMYTAYLVRLWQDSPGDGWRASAQSVQSGETVRFGSLHGLFAFLETESGSLTDTAGTE